MGVKVIFTEMKITSTWNNIKLQWRVLFIVIGLSGEVLFVEAHDKLFTSSVKYRGFEICHQNEISIELGIYVLLKRF